MRGLVLILATAVMVGGESLGPPKGALGTIDWRYPDYIVKPVPPCPFVGVFPHPADCTWYYRCYSHVTLGRVFYRRAYFKCEPGTSFSDGLDQCVHPQGGASSCRPPMNETCSEVTDQCDHYTVCYKDGFSAESRYLCQVAYVKCDKSGTVTPRCSNQQYYDPLRKQCFPHPDEAKCPDCTPRADRCSTHRVCLGPRPEQLLLCEEAYKCSNGVLTRFCPYGSLYSQQYDRCVGFLADIQCPACKDSSVDCKKYEVCDATGQLLGTHLMCKKATKCKAGVAVPACSLGQYYDQTLGGVCVTAPDGEKCKKPCEPIQENCSKKEFCNSYGQRVKAFLCSKASLCDANGNLLDTCPANSLFDPQNKKCHTTSSCNDLMKDCKHYEICDKSGNKTSEFLCREAFKYAYDNTIIPICPPNMFYSPRGNRCFPDPETMKCDTVTEIISSGQVRCSKEYSHPFESWMSEYCNRVLLCNQINKDYLCPRYYRCETQFDGSLKAIELECAKGFRFSYNALRCIPTPQANEICEIELNSGK